MDCGGFGGGFAHGRDGTLGGVEEAGSFSGIDDPDEHGVGDAGNEVADVLVAIERGHGPAVGFGSFGFVRLAFGNGGQEGAVSGAAAANNAQVLNGRAVDEAEPLTRLSAAGMNGETSGMGDSLGGWTVFFDCAPGAGNKLQTRNRGKLFLFTRAENEGT
jgi:hypothetical protein